LPLALGGFILLDINPAVGAFVSLGFVSTATVVCIEDFITKQRIRAMRDAQIEMDYYTEQYRRTR
jgi:hypothetical protein